MKSIKSAVSTIARPMYYSAKRDQTAGLPVSIANLTRQGVDQSSAQRVEADQRRSYMKNTGLVSKAVINTGTITTPNIVTVQSGQSRLGNSVRKDYHDYYVMGVAKAAPGLVSNSAAGRADLLKLMRYILGRSPFQHGLAQLLFLAIPDILDTGRRINRTRDVDQRNSAVVVRQLVTAGTIA